MEFFVIWFFLAGLIAWWASEWGRSGGGYFLLALFGSPLLGAIVLLVAGNKSERDAAAALKTEEQRREHERQLESLRSIASTANAPTQSTVPSVADELAKLASLRERGLLTDDELAEQKRRLLAMPII